MELGKFSRSNRTRTWFRDQTRFLSVCSIKSKLGPKIQWFTKLRFFTCCVIHLRCLTWRRQKYYSMNARKLILNLLIKITHFTVTEPSAQFRPGSSDHFGPDPNSTFLYCCLLHRDCRIFLSMRRHRHFPIRKRKAQQCPIGTAILKVIGYFISSLATLAHSTVHNW